MYGLTFSFGFCFFKQKTAYEMRISDWSSDVCSSDLGPDTQHWLPRGPESALDDIPGDDGVPLLGTTLAQLRDPVGFTDRMVARHGKVYRANSFVGRGVSLGGADANEPVMFDRDKLFASEQGSGPARNHILSTELILIGFEKTDPHHKTT